MKLTSVFALCVALGAAAAMLMTKPAAQSAPTSAELTLEQAFPGAKPEPVKETVADGAPFSPLFFVDTKRSLGTADAADGSVRLLQITPSGERELRKLPRAQTPEFAGFATDGKSVVWLELTTTADGRAETRVWAIDSEAGAARLVTADTGDVALFDKRDDVVIHDGEVSWLAAARTPTPQTEIRTVPLAGGKVKIETREGAFSFAGWPWLSTVNLGEDGPVELRNLETDERTVVGVQANELMACSPVWCRALIIGSTQSSTVIELLKPDGSLRLRTASGSVAASIVDVALLDRYEVYSYADGRLALFDLEERRSITIAKNISQVASRGPVLWWSTGDNETLAWHVLDLRTLKP